MSEVGVDIDIGPGCLAQVRAQASTNHLKRLLMLIACRCTGTDFLPCSTTTCRSPYTATRTGVCTRWRPALGGSVDCASCNFSSGNLSCTADAMFDSRWPSAFSINALPCRPLTSPLPCRPLTYSPHRLPQVTFANETVLGKMSGKVRRESTVMTCRLQAARPTPSCR